jgi:hypothetical protein
VLERCYRGVTEVLQRCHRGVTEVLQRCYRGIRYVLQIVHMLVHLSVSDCLVAIESDMF